MKKTVNTAILLVVLGVFYSCFDQDADYAGALHYETESIFVIDNDVYVSGWYYLDKTTDWVDCYWVNGERVDRSVIEDAKAISAKYGDTTNFSFRDRWRDYPYIVSNGDLYAVYDGGYTKNGDETEVVLDELEGVENTHDNFYGMFVSGEDVYIIGEIVGHDSNGNRKDLTFLWKNGVAEYFDRDCYCDITVSGSDVYTIDSRHAYRNNVFIEGSFSPFNCYKYIQVDGGDVYILGWVTSADPGSYTADYCYWKNNEKIDISEDDDEWVTSMFVNNGDVYFASWYTTNGYYSPDMFSSVEYSRPCYYKNGERIDLE
ncbi:MAG TPA: hypothetical protein PK926_12405 [Spirochaetota bacterium]|nr:hypothetical protein [Spirochaetota bacterium]HPI88916.1 hypothetical protein [Spirochaetota bacterium]HPR46607.1 hypothetical protein [Spirochaetota bacterium]